MRLLKLVSNLLAAEIFMTNATKHSLRTGKPSKSLKDQDPASGVGTPAVLRDSKNRSGQTVVLSKGGFIVLNILTG